MAARLNRHHSEEIRQKIQASVIIDRLTKHVNGELELSSTQIAAAQTLLDRSVPKLSQIQHVGDADNPVAHSLKVEFVNSVPREA
jgi:hypothetical protein